VHWRITSRYRIRAIDNANLTIRETPVTVAHSIVFSGALLYHILISILQYVRAACGIRDPRLILIFFLRVHVSCLYAYREATSISIARLRLHYNMDI